mgnify:FL=1
MGYIEETGAAQHLRDARITTIYEGTTGIQAGDLLGRKIIRDDGQESRRLLHEIQACADECHKNSNPNIQMIGSELKQSIQLLEKALDWLLKTHTHHPQATLAGAYPLLKSFGIVCGAWLLAKSALILEKDSGPDQSFASQKIASAIFYMHEVLPQVEGLVRTICAGESVVKAMNDGLADLMH